MNRLALVVTALAGFAGCVDQQSTDPEDLGTTEQDLTSQYSNVWPVFWNPQTNTGLLDFWDVNQPNGTWSRQMYYFVTKGEPASSANAAFAYPETKFVWVVGNQRVFKVWEVQVTDLAAFNAARSNMANAWEGYAAAAGYSDVNDGVVSGPEGGDPLGGLRHGGPPHAYPLATVRAMFDAGQSMHSLVISIPKITAGSLQ